MNSLKVKLLLLAIVCMHVSNAQSASKDAGQTIKHGTLLTERLTSTILKENRTGLDPNRSVKVFLPPNYADSQRSYPVVYYCHNIFWSAEKLFEDGRLVSLLEGGFANGVVKEFILVAADYSTPTTGSVYENSPTTGRWLDFTVKELVPFIDSKFRTIKNRESRALIGDLMGGRGALKLAMVNPDVFSVVYALHPVATGTGDIPWPYVNIDWKKIHQAKSFDDINDGRTMLFVTFCQAFLPNPNRPPFYCNFFMEIENGEPKLNVANAIKMEGAFLLDETLNEFEKNLRSMRGIGFDWGRFDETRAHVESNRDFSRKLQDLGIEHEAEEYAGNTYDKNWIDNGRFYSRVLPFLERYLVFK